MILALILFVGFACAWISYLIHTRPTKFKAWFYSTHPTPPAGDAKRDKSEPQSVFAMFDRNSDGFITKQELRESLESLGLYTTDNDLLSMVDKLDSNGDGLIDADEFYLVYESMGRKVKKMERQEQDCGSDGEEEEEEEEEDNEYDDGDLREAFDVFDENGDGLISGEELCGVLSTLALKEEVWRMEECKDMISKVDTDGDGMVNFNEFKQMMKASKFII